jgi:hypothetical protein
MEKENYDVEAKPSPDLNPPITNLRYTWTQIEDGRLRERMRVAAGRSLSIALHRETKTGTVFVLERSGKALAVRGRRVLYGVHVRCKACG